MLQVHNEPAGALYDPNKDTLYVTKAICLIATVPIVCAAKVRINEHANWDCCR